jgi:hypothetical protein
VKQYRLFKGITAIIDASTSRADELDSLKKVDWDGKLYLIEAAKQLILKDLFSFQLKMDNLKIFH